MKCKSAIELPDFDPSIYNDAIRGQHLLAMKALRQKFGIDENRTHVEKGLPEEVIPDLSEHLQAGIVVLGTIGCLIVLGGLGFFVWEDCLEHRSWRRLSFYSRMVLAVTGALILGDRMSGKEYLGCVLMFAAIILVQLPDRVKK